MAARKPSLDGAAIDWVAQAARNVEDLARIKRRQDALDQLRIETQQTSHGYPNGKNGSVRPSPLDRPIL